MQKSDSKRWRGILADEEAMSRHIAAATLCVLVVSMVAAQYSFFPFGNAHVILLLAPIALSSLLLGKWQGCAVGAIAGAAEMGHSIYLPYDFYEMYFASPFTSIVLFALFGLIMGALFALACRLPRRPLDGVTEESPRGIARKVALVGACAAGAAFATAFFHIGILVFNFSNDVKLPAEMAARMLGPASITAQAVLDLLAVSVVVVATDYATARLNWRVRKRSVRVTFQIWLAVITVMFFFVVSGVSYAMITIVDLRNTDVALSDHIDLISTELSKRDKTMEAVDKRTDLTSEERRDFEKLIYDNLDCDLPGWLEDTVIIANGDDIFSTNNAELKNKSFAEVIGHDLVRDSLDDVLKSGATHLCYEGSGTQISYLRANEVPYEYVDDNGNLQTDSYKIAVIVTARETFLHRWAFLLLVAVLFVVLLGGIITMSLKLVDIVVVKPIDGTNAVLGRITAGELDQRVPDNNSTEFAALSEGINITVGALEESIAEANARIDRELATARAIQASALPSVQPPFPDIDAFDLYATMDPAREVGGDFYDFFELGPGKIGFVVADVSGKGIPAALFMMSAKTAIRGAMEAKADLAKAIGIANRSLCEGNESEMFVTAFAGVLEYGTGKLTFVNAGHNKPLIMRDGAWSWLTERSGPYLGSFDWVEYKQFETQLNPGDELFAYTDGVNEAFNANGELYGNARLEAFLTAHTEQHPRQLLRSLRSDLIGWEYGAEQSDDITMLAIKFGIPPENGATLDIEASLDNFEIVSDFVEGLLEEAGCPPKETNHVLIAVEELVVNVCSYAYPDAPEDKPGPLRVHFTARNRPNAAIIEICDDGVPFDPLERADPERPKSIEEAKVGGLGLLMTRKLMDQVEYVREGISNVTIITKTWEG